MQITSLKVRNFKSLNSVDVSGFATVNFIHGYNNSGKSNFLKFLELLFTRKTISSPEEYIDENGVKRIRNKVVSITPFWNGYIYDSPFLFSNNNRENEITFEVRLEVLNDEYPKNDQLLAADYLYKNRNSTPITIIGAIESLNQNDSEMKLQKVILKDRVIYTNNEGAEKYFEEPGNSPLSGNSDLFNEILDLFNDCVLLIGSERYFTKEKLSQESPDIFNTANFKNWLYTVSLDADKFEKFTDLIDFLNNFNLTSKVSKALETNLSSYPFKKTAISFSRFNDEIEIMLENPIGRFPLKNYGTGIQQIFFILSKLFDTNAKIILIEELELNLSPEYQELIINNLQNFVSSGELSQVFFTSHSDYLNRADFKIFEVSIAANGQSSIKSSDYTALKALRRSFMDFSEKGK